MSLSDFPFKLQLRKAMAKERGKNWCGKGILLKNGSKVINQSDIIICLRVILILFLWFRILPHFQLSISGCRERGWQKKRTKRDVKGLRSPFGPQSWHLGKSVTKLHEKFSAPWWDWMRWNGFGAVLASHYAIRISLQVWQVTLIIYYGWSKDDFRSAFYIMKFHLGSFGSVRWKDLKAFFHAHTATVKRERNERFTVR